MKKLIITESEKIDILKKHKLINEQSTVPFKNREEGDKFRQWVNKNYPEVAKRYALDPSGPFNNQNIKWAFNHKIGNDTLGDKYLLRWFNFGFGGSSQQTTPKTKTGKYSANKVVPNADKLWKTTADSYSKTPRTVPFKNREEGDKFRQWVNKNYSEVAKRYALDPSGPFNNQNIKWAFNHKIGNDTLGDKYLFGFVGRGKQTNKQNMANKEEMSSSEYQEYIKKYKGKNLYGIDPKATKRYSKFSEVEPEDWYQTKGFQKRSIELNPNITGELSGTGERINKEVYYIKKNNKNKNKPFLVIDPRMNIVAAYSSDYKLIDYSQTVKGRDTELLKPHTYSDWCKDSGGIKYKGICIKPGTESQLDKIIETRNQELLKAKGNVEEIKKIQKKYEDAKYKIKGLDYGKLIGTAAASPGTFVGVNPEWAQYGTPKEKIPNLISLQTLDGETLPTAIHGLAEHLPGRIELDNQLKSFLKKEKQFGNIPKEYESLVEKMAETKKYGESSGCFNVSNKFIQNPKVTEILNKKPYIFVMSQEKDYYLVQMDSNQGTKFFNELKGDGTSCKNPTSLATEVGGNPIDIRTMS